MKSYFKISIILLLFVGYVHGKQESPQGKEFKKLLNGLTLPHVSFEEGDTLLDAISFAISRTIEQDVYKKEGQRPGFARFVTDKSKHIKSCVILPAGTKNISIIYKGRSIILNDFLVEIARQSKLDLYATSDGLVFSRPDKESREKLRNEKRTIWFAIHKENTIKIPKSP